MAFLRQTRPEQRNSLRQSRELAKSENSLSQRNRMPEQRNGKPEKSARGVDRQRREKRQRSRPARGVKSQRNREARAEESPIPLPRSASIREVKSSARGQRTHRSSGECQSGSHSADKIREVIRSSGDSHFSGESRDFRPSGDYLLSAS